MIDPYKILGISPYDTDEKIKSAYKELAKKYHPDIYNNNSDSKMAEEKMKEINDAYDQIMEERRKKRAENYSSYASFNGDVSNNYNDVRNLIMVGRIADAEQILNGVPDSQRNAEWYFLKGTVLYKMGWLEDAYNNFNRATSMDPENQEYKAAINRINKQRSGFYGGYNPATSTGCNGCNICTSLLCADCCCECMGGDFIRCC